MIKSATFKNYRITDFIQFITNILKIVKRHDPAKLKIGEAFTALAQHHESLEAVDKQDSLSEITPQLAQLDAIRDQAIICLRQVCEGYTNYPDEKLSAAGKTIVACIDQYGSRLYNLHYGAETTTLKKLIRKLHKSVEYTQALKLLHMDALVQQMQEANQQFEDLFIERLAEYSEFEGKTTRELTQLTTEAYRTLVQHIEAHALLTPSPKYDALINLMNENIEHYNQIVERRKNGGEAEEVEVIAKTEPAE